MIELSTLRDLIAIFGVLAGFSYYVLTVRNNQRNQRLTLETRQAQLHLHIYDSMISSEFIEKWAYLFSWEWDSFEDFLKKYGPADNRTDWSQFVSIGNYLENIGLLVKRGLIDAEYVDDLISGDVIAYWERFHKLVYDIRREFHWPSYNEWVEYLYNEVKPLVQNQHPDLELDKMIFGKYQKT